MSIAISPLTTYDQYKACEQLQAEVLGFDALDVVPYQLLQSFATSGGAVIGAFDDGELVGAVMGYTGLLPDGTPYHRSQRMAVRIAYRSMGIGERLKRAQATLARQYGLRLMCWTYDPLRAPNAYLNIHKLGAISRRYIQNAYRVSSSVRDMGAPIDRLWVEWDLIGERPLPVLLDSQYVIVLRDEAGWPSTPDLSLSSDVLLIQIPADIEDVRARWPESWPAWRRVTRAAFTHYLGQGYEVVDYVRDRGYVLTRPQVRSVVE
jgi:predicted GNAT superfamily acetyltransferase